MEEVEVTGRSTCRGEDCDTEIVWVKRGDKNIPYDSKPTNFLSTDTLGKHYIYEGHIPHHITCPNSEDF